MNTLEYEYHELSKFFPMLPDKEFEALKESIAKIGQREAIVLYEDKILDGRNRYEACVSLGIEPKTTEMNGDIDPLEFVAAANIRRRHLMPGEKIAILRKIYPPVPADDGGPGRGKEKRARTGHALSRSELAQKAGVSVKSVRDFDEAVAVEPELAQEVEKGKMSPYQARREAERIENRGTWRFGKDIPPLIDSVDALNRWSKTVEGKVDGRGKPLHHDAAQFLGNKLDEVIERLVSLRGKLKEMENVNA